MPSIVNVSVSGRSFSRVALSLVLSLATLLAVSAPSASAASAPGWKVAKKLRTGLVHRVSAVSGAAFAIGERDGAPLIMRFDGARWSEMPAPGLAELAGVYELDELEHVRIHLNGVFTRTASDAWVVGHAIGTNSDGNGAPWPITMHWDGSEWRFVRAATFRSVGYLDYSTLRDVVAFGPDDVWAVGGWGGEGEAQPIAMHWDGSSWTFDQRAQLGPDAGGDLYAAARTPYAQTLWTVGHGWDRLTETVNGPLVERFRSDTWTQTTALPGLVLGDVAALAWNDIWAVSGPTVLHRDAARWSVVPTPQAPAGGYRTLSAISGVSSNNVWAVGSGSDSAAGPQQALIEHWDGGSWTVVPAPADVRYLSDVAMRKSGYGWAVGDGAILRHHP